MFRSSRRSRGWPGVEADRGCGGVSTAKPSGRRSSEGGGGVPVAGVPEGSEEVAGKLLRDDVVLLVPSAGAKGSVAASRQRGRAAAELELVGAMGDDARVSGQRLRRRSGEVRWSG
jgi:hypothetical protein